MIHAEGLGKRYRLGSGGGFQIPKPFRRRRRQLGPVGPSTPDSVQDDYIWALRDVSFDITEGDALGVIGRNGAGKSTLLKILARITEPTTGWVRIQGRVASLLEVGTGFHPELTGRENIFLNGAILGMKRSEIARKFDDILDFAGVEPFVDTPIKRYSSGMQVRLAFAVAAHLEPEVLLVDEVLAVGDAEFQQKCLGKMRGATQQGRTVIFVSHNLSAVSSLCSRGIFLSEGRIAVDGSVEEALNGYLARAREHQLGAGRQVSLSDHPGRPERPLGSVRLDHIRMSDGRGGETYRSGEDLIVRLGYRLDRPTRASSVEFILIVAELLGERVFSCSNVFVGTQFDELARQSEVACRIPRLPLMPGSYNVTVTCMTGSEWSDGVDHAAEFQVIGGDFFSTGQLPPEGWGRTLVDQIWSHSAEASPTGEERND